MPQNKSRLVLSVGNANYTQPTLSNGTTYYWRARARDAAGNWSSYSGSRTFTIDTSAPTSNSISIAGGATYTTSTSVTLTLASTGASTMKFQNDSAGYGSFEAYATSKSWSLANTQGTRTVYVIFKDAAGNEASAVSDTIVFDNVAPSVPSLTSPANAYYTNDTTKKNYFWPLYAPRKKCVIKFYNCTV